jgi:hypothetical protein
MKALLLAGVLALTPAQTSAAAPAEVTVYFSKGYGIPGAVVPVTRTSPHAGVARFAVEQLIKGPTKAERRRGLHSELTGKLRGRSDCGADFRLRIRKGTATLRFCRTVMGAGLGSDARALWTIERTLKQFPSVKRVVTLARDGRCLFDQTDSGRSCITGHE